MIDWITMKEHKRRLRETAWWWFILGAVFGFLFGLIADGAHAMLITGYR